MVFMFCINSLCIPGHVNVVTCTNEIINPFVNELWLVEKYYAAAIKQQMVSEEQLEKIELDSKF